MRRDAIAAALAVVAVAGCGSAAKKVGTSPQAKADTAKAEAQLRACLPPDPAALTTSRGARKRFEACVFPPAHRLAGERCMATGLLSGIPTKARIESVTLTCIWKAE